MATTPEPKAPATWTIRICNWREFQHYKDRDPPWIKLHQRRLFPKRAWRELPGDPAKLLVDLWMLAAGTRDGELALALDDLAYQIRRPGARVGADLQVLEGTAFVELSTQMRAAASTAQADDAPEGEGETEGETEAEQRESSVASLPAAPPESAPPHGNGGSPGNPMAVLGPLIRQHLYIHDGKPPEGWNPDRCADLLTRAIRSGRYSVDDLRDMLETVGALRRAPIGRDSDSLRRWIIKQGKITARVLFDTWGSGLVSEQLLHLAHKRDARKPTKLGVA